MPARCLLLGAMVCLLAGPAAARCLDYQPSVVTLAGELESRLLPGPPNYKSIARGDRPETIWFLRLDQAICVKGDPSSTLRARSHAGVEEVQLSAPPRDTGLAGRKVRATGSLLGAQSGEHRTPVVLKVSGLRSE